MPIREDARGKVDISSATIATIANQAVHQCYGVVGMTSKNLVDGIARLLSRDNRRGVDISMEGDQIIIGVYVILEYGVPVRTVAESIQHTVKFHVEKTLGLPIYEVNVFIQGLRESNNN